MNQHEIIGHFIGGHVVDTAGDRYADVFNPALGEPCARVTLASVDAVSYTHLTLPTICSV